MPTVNLRTGISMYYESEGEGEPVIFISGTSSDHTGWMFQAPAHSEEFQVITFDNRGVGQTDKPDDPDAYSVAGMAEDTVALLDELGIERVHFVGNSLGSAICQEAAISHPQRVRSLQLYGTWGRTDRWLRCVFEGVSSSLRRGDMTSYAGAIPAWILSPEFVNDEERFTRFMELRAKNPHPPTAASIFGQYQADIRHDTLDRLGNITVPTLVISGEIDWMVPTRLGREVAARIPGAEFRLFEGPRASHLLAVEMPQELNQASLEFLRRHSGT